LAKRIGRRSPVYQLGAGPQFLKTAMSEAVINPKCPHCGGIHLGQRFDDCPYVKLVSDETATLEQRHNAAEWLRLKAEEDSRV